MPTRMNLEIYAHTQQFRKLFKCSAYTDSFLMFQCVREYYFSVVSIYKTSPKCYRVMTYISHCSSSRESDYSSYRSIIDMCVYLEKLAERLR